MQTWIQRNWAEFFGFLKLLSYLAAFVVGIFVLVFNIIFAAEQSTPWALVFGTLILIATLPGIMILGNWAPKDDEQDAADRWAEIYLALVVIVATLLNVAVYWIF